MSQPPPLITIDDNLEKYISDVEYMQNNLFKALKVPKSYLENEPTNKDSLTREVLFEKYNDGFASMRKTRQNTIDKWANSGLLDGLKGPVKSNIAQLLEAQSSCLINDISDNKRIYNVSGVSSRGFEKKTFLSKIKSFFISVWQKIFKKKKEETNFDTIAFPLVRRVFAQTIANDLVSVQPLSLPTGLLFYMDSPEREDVYTSKVLVEKYKPYQPSKYTGSTMEDYYLPNRGEDYFIPVR